MDKTGAAREALLEEQAGAGTITEAGTDIGTGADAGVVESTVVEDGTKAESVEVDDVDPRNELWLCRNRDENDTTESVKVGPHQETERLLGGLDTVTDECFGI